MSIKFSDRIYYINRIVSYWEKYPVILSKEMFFYTSFASGRDRPAKSKKSYY